MKGFWARLGESALELAAYMPATLVGLAPVTAAHGDAPAPLVLVVMLAPTLALLVADGVAPLRSLVLSVARTAGETFVVWLALGGTALPLPDAVLRALWSRGFGGDAMNEALVPVAAPLVAAFLVFRLVALYVVNLKNDLEAGPDAAAENAETKDVINQSGATRLHGREMPGADGLLR